MPADRLPDRFRDLAWRTFFADRGRGLSLDAHFPWLSDPAGRATAVVARVGDAAAAMLIVREGLLPVDGADHAIAAMGLVCTDPAWRGRGLASALIETATAVSTRADVALLWTRQAAFYERLGFETADPTVTGIVRIDPVPTPLRQREVRFDGSALSGSAVFGGRRGIPPFVERVRVLEADDVAIAIGETPAGDLPVLLEWTGDPDRVLDLAAGLGAPAMRWNGADRDPLAAAAIRRGCALDLQPTGLAMWRPLSNRAPSLAALASNSVPLLDRF